MRLRWNSLLKSQAGALIALLSGLCLATGPAAAGARPQLTWINQFEKGQELAEKNAKPMLIDFWASWCGPCRRMDRESWADKAVIEASQRYVSIAVDVDKDKAAGSRYQVHELPTVILADPWGRPLVRRSGFIYPHDLAALLGSVPADFTPVRETHEILAHDVHNASALALMGKFYTTAGAFDFAIEYYKDAMRTQEGKSSPQLRSELCLAVGADQLLLRNWNDARKTLRQFLKDFPDSPHTDEALLGLVLADCKQGKVNDAEKELATLKEQFPLSHSTETAARVFARKK